MIKLTMLLVFTNGYIGISRANTSFQKSSEKVIIKITEKQKETMPRAQARICNVSGDGTKLNELFIQESDNGQFVFDNVPVGKYLLFIDWLEKPYIFANTNVQNIEVQPYNPLFVSVAFPQLDSYYLVFEKIREQKRLADLIIHFSDLGFIYLVKPEPPDNLKITKASLSEFLANLSVQKNLAIISTNMVPDDDIIISTESLLKKLGFRKIIIHETSCLGTSIFRE